MMKNFVLVAVLFAVAVGTAVVGLNWAFPPGPIVVVSAETTYVAPLSEEDRANIRDSQSPPVDWDKEAAWGRPAAPSAVRTDTGYAKAYQAAYDRAETALLPDRAELLDAYMESLVDELASRVDARAVAKARIFAANAEVRETVWSLFISAIAEEVVETGVVVDDLDDDKLARAIEGCEARFGKKSGEVVGSMLAAWIEEF